MILVVSLLIAVALYYYQGEFTWVQALIAFLGVLAIIQQVVGVGLIHLFERKPHQARDRNLAETSISPEIPRIELRRTYREGPVQTNEIVLVGHKAVEQYVDGMSRFLLSRSHSATPEIAEAAKLVQTENYREADVKVTEAIRLLEGYTVKQPMLLLSQIYLIKGDIAFDKGHFGASEGYYDLSHDLAREIKDQLLVNASSHGVAIAKGRQGDHTKALEILDQVLKSNAKDAIAWYNKGVALGGLRRYEDSLRAYDEAIRLDTKSVASWYNKGVALDDLGRHEDALRAYDEALRLDPKDAASLNNKGAALSALNRYREALPIFGKAVELDPEDALIWYNRGVVLSRLDRREEAVSCYDEATTLDPSYAEAWHNKGGSLGILGRYEEALLAIDEAIRLNPKNGMSWNNKGVALGSLGRHEESLSAFNEATKLTPNDSMAWYNMAVALDRLGRNDEAGKALDHALQIDPNYDSARDLKRLIEMKIRSTKGRSKKASISE